MGEKNVGAKEGPQLQKVARNKRWLTGNNKECLRTTTTTTGKTKTANKYKKLKTNGNGITPAATEKSGSNTSAEEDRIEYDGLSIDYSGNVISPTQLKGDSIGIPRLTVPPDEYDSQTEKESVDKPNASAPTSCGLARLTKDDYDYLDNYELSDSENESNEESESESEGESDEKSESESNVARGAGREENLEPTNANNEQPDSEAQGQPEEGNQTRKETGKRARGRPKNSKTDLEKKALNIGKKGNFMLKDLILLLKLNYLDEDFVKALKPGDANRQNEAKTKILGRMNSARFQRKQAARKKGEIIAKRHSDKLSLDQVSKKKTELFALYKEKKDAILMDDTGNQRLVPDGKTIEEIIIPESMQEIWGVMCQCFGDKGASLNFFDDRPTEDTQDGDVGVSAYDSSTSIESSASRRSGKMGKREQVKESFDESVKSLVKKVDVRDVLQEMVNRNTEMTKSRERMWEKIVPQFTRLDPVDEASVESESQVKVVQKGLKSAQGDIRSLQDSVATLGHKTEQSIENLQTNIDEKFTSIDEKFMLLADLIRNNGGHQ